MKLSRWFSIVFVVVAILYLVSSSSLVYAAPSSAGCTALKSYAESLMDATFNKPVTKVSTTWVAASGSTPEHCVVQGRIWPETDVQVKLPTVWNNRYFQVGGGGVNGTISTSQVNYYLSQSYAAAGSTGGHDGAIDSGPEYGLKEPFYSLWFPGRRPGGNIYADQMLIDFGHRSLMETNVLARKIINYYYNADPLYSYFYGCSNGGKEGLVIAQKYPDLFDGIIVGDPVASNLGTPMRRVWGGYWATKAQLKIAEKAVALNKFVYNKCDSIDGLVDGLIDDPQKCVFDPITEFPACENEADTTNKVCFTLAQRQALEKIYGPPMNSAGQALYVSQSPSAEYLTNPTNPMSSGFSAAFSGCPSCDIARYWFFDPPFSLSWDWTTFNWDTYPPLMKAKTLTDAVGNSYLFSAVVDPVTFDANVSPNMGGLGPFYAHGAKLIHFHGWADATVPPLISTRFYEAVRGAIGDAQTRSFYKLFMVPGMGHCAGGVGCFNGDMGLWTSALVNWRENEIAPNVLTGARTATQYLTARTRPLCPYPQVARYIGAGSIDEATNFICVEAEEAGVAIEQDTLSLSSGKSIFTVTIDIPQQGDWRATSATCEGAFATTLVRHGHSYTATFNKADLKNITVGDSVVFTVTLFVEHQGNHNGNPDNVRIVFEGSDTVKITQ